MMALARVLENIASAPGTRRASPPMATRYRVAKPSIAPNQAKLVSPVPAQNAKASSDSTASTVSTNIRQAT